MMYYPHTIIWLVLSFKGTNEIGSDVYNPKV